ncbi:TetR family transcriptional regulator [Duganella sp. FT50W]|uniref:TetR family transcriptional regulator n=1 Tax=Duganella lactea TaxID=2692173 RepID=A0A6L8MTT5_9BURK|nr:TetR/AcrR family transcriptional regulator [Duganella lactea]MYM85495.1 TetR family transcriptional regulator [Duganella lactea]
MPITQGTRLSNRNTLLDVLESLISEHSVHDVTLDEVALRAGVTKGGLIYHFKSKEALLLALVDRMRIRVESHCVDPTEVGKKTLRKFLTDRINYAFSMQQKEKRTMANLLVVTSSYPSLLGPVKVMYHSGIEALEGASEQAGLLLSVWTALDGFVLLEMLNLHHFSELEKKEMKAALLNLVSQRLCEK